MCVMQVLLVTGSDKSGHLCHSKSEKTRGVWNVCRVSIIIIECTRNVCCVSIIIIDCTGFCIWLGKGPRV